MNAVALITRVSAAAGGLPLRAAGLIEYASGFRVPPPRACLCQ
jgi:hypothetical protein